jgi:hypothetical protein
MQAAFPPESDIPPPNDDDEFRPSQQIGGLKPVAVFGFAGQKTTGFTINNEKPMIGAFGAQQPATGCVFPRPFTTEQKTKMDINGSIYAQLSLMREQINQLNSGIDKMYELLAKNH